MTDERYTVFPNEQEYLFFEGMGFYIVDIDDDFEIKNKNKMMKKYNGKKVTVIYLQSRY